MKTGLPNPEYDDADVASSRQPQAAPTSSTSEREPATRGSLLPAIELPSGGGGVRGMGETYSIDLQSGTGGAVIPIATLPGRAGTGPELSLRYDTAGATGPYGIGWNLSVPRISRRTERGLPRYIDTDESDTFVLSGAEELVPVPYENDDGASLWTSNRAGYTIRRYRPRTEGTFARIERWDRDEDGRIHWVVTGRDNVVSIYGRESEAQIADPAQPSRVFAWLLQETRDPRGHAIRYSYKQEDDAGVSPTDASERVRFGPAGEYLATAQRYLHRIQYGNLRAPDPDLLIPLASDEDDYLFEILFDFGELDGPTADDPHASTAPHPVPVRDWQLRLDGRSNHRPGFELRTQRLCRRILSLSRFPGEAGGRAGPTLVSSTDFFYEEGPTVTYLRAAVGVGYEWDRSASYYKRATLPELAFNYARVPERLSSALVELDDTSAELIGLESAASSVEFVDLDGEGLPGLLIERAAGLEYAPSRGQGQFGTPVELSTLPNFAPGQLQRATLSDLDGNGRLDLVRTSGGRRGTNQRSEARNWSSFRPFDAGPAIDWADPNLRFADVSGDGRADVLITEGEHIVWHESRGRAGYGPPFRISLDLGSVRGPRVLFSDKRTLVALADISGDGLPDIVQISRAEVRYWPNLGYGRFGDQHVLDNPPAFPRDPVFDPRRVRLADFDGSGTTDIAYWGRDGVHVYLNQSGNSLADVQILGSISYGGPSERLDIVDLLGKGISCLVWTTRAAGARARSRYACPAGENKPHLLDHIDNNLGSETRIQYASSSDYYLADQRDRPWLTRLPFPVQVVARVERRDAISRSRLTTEYRYRHGYWDGVEREFRGFAMVETRDAESFDTPPDAGPFEELAPAVEDGLALAPVVTRTWFHTGAWQGGEFEQKLAAEYYAGDHSAPRLPDTIRPRGVDAATEADLVRALRGRVLRQEVYAEDEGPESSLPYSVTESNYELRLIRARTGERPAVVFAYPRETLSFNYERSLDDPRVGHELTLDVDAFGNVLRSVSVAYPRRSVGAGPPEAIAAQARPWATLAEARFINVDDQLDWYRTGVVAESSSWELTGLVLPGGASLLSLDDVRAGVELASDWHLPFESTRGADQPGLRLIAASQTRYRDDELAPLPIGRTSALGLSYETYELALTPGLVESAIGHGVTDAELRNAARYLRGDEIPRALEVGTDPATELGAESWWTRSGYAEFTSDADARARFYQPARARDPFGQLYNLRYDAHALLLEQTTDPVGNTTNVVNDYRVLKPARHEDANGGVTTLGYDARGMVVWLAREGRPGLEADKRDSQELPSATYEYDPHSWRLTRGLPLVEARQPAFARTTRRETHGPGARMLQSVAYFDGRGREVSRKGRVRDGTDEDGLAVERWVGSGRVVLDNKDNPIKQYEPYFAPSAAFDWETTLVRHGVTPVLRYDPLGRLVCVEHPDGTSTKVEFSAWHTSSWDPNDTVETSRWLSERLANVHGAAARRAAVLSLQHAETPTVQHLDSLGRPVVTVDRNRFERPSVDAGPALATDELHVSYVELDVSGNQLALVDARGITVERQVFDVIGRVLQTISPDAGNRWRFPDIGDKPIRAGGERGFEFRYAYDGLQRPTDVWVDSGGATRLAQRIIYGEGQPNDQSRHLRGEIAFVYDGAGRLENERFDFKGNPLRMVRQLRAAVSGEVDWSGVDADSAAGLEPGLGYATEMRYDAVDRLVSNRTSDGSETTNAYDLAGLLERVELEKGGVRTTYVSTIDYNARGQRTRVVWGNAMTTDYAYDPLSFRLARTTVTRSANGILRDVNYVYDAAGNMTEFFDAARHDSGGATQPKGRYHYDSLYRLVQAQGREHPGQQPAGATTWVVNSLSRRGAPIVRVPDPGDNQALRSYTRRYFYDPGGNIERIQHYAATSSTSWTRRYEYEPTSNRLVRTSLPGSGGTNWLDYGHDAHGNIESIGAEQFTWNHAERLASIDLGGGGHAYYHYDSSGQRVRKLIVRGGVVVDERVYLGDLEIYWRRSAAGTRLRRETIHVMDDEARVALVETITDDASVPATSLPRTRVRYQMADHLGSVNHELDENERVVTYEECYPFGGCAYAAARSGAAHDYIEVNERRYRYNGKELDGESGFYYYGARYYMSWLGRWVSVDPAGFPDGTNRYTSVRNSPIQRRDSAGLASDDTTYSGPTIGPGPGVGVDWSKAINNVPLFGPVVSGTVGPWMGLLTGSDPWTEDELEDPWSSSAVWVDGKPRYVSMEERDPYRETYALTVGVQSAISLVTLGMFRFMKPKVPAPKAPNRTLKGLKSDYNQAKKAARSRAPDNASKTKIKKLEKEANYKTYGADLDSPDVRVRTTRGGPHAEEQLIDSRQMVLSNEPCAKCVRMLKNKAKAGQSTRVYTVTNSKQARPTTALRQAPDTASDLSLKFHSDYNPNYALPAAIATGATNSQVRTRAPLTSSDLLQPTVAEEKALQSLPPDMRWR